MSSQFIKDFLADKDSQEIQSHVPKSWKMTPHEKFQNLTEQTRDTEYYHRVIMGCLKPCIVNIESPVVGQQESDCLTNCTTKGLETLSMFKLLNVSETEPKL